MMNIVEHIVNKIFVKSKCFKKRFRLVDQFCKHCGRDMGYDYHIPDEMWSKLPEKYQNHVLCIHCFCKLYPEPMDEYEIPFYK